MVTHITINDQPVVLEHVRSDLTLLEYLREDLHATGTKEGCASGDCGACTVVLVTGAASDLASDWTNEGKVCCRSINSCITFVHTLDGCRIYTADNDQPDELLQRIRETLVRHHASQCGFCTPGFVMSIYSMIRNVESGKEQANEDGNWLPVIERYLGGNLCRCTGYRPIIEACESLLHKTSAIATKWGNEQTKFKSNSETTGGELFYRPKNLSALDDLLTTKPDSTLLAGGTDLALEVTQNLRDFPSIIWLGQVEGLDDFELTDSGCTIGATVKLATLREILAPIFPELGHLLERFGSEQIRQQGTIGGNVGTASPIGDLPPVLLVLDSVAVLRSAQGERDVPLANYFKSYRLTDLAAGEFIRAIKIPGLNKFTGSPPESFLKIYKISKRMDDDISAVCMACNISVASGNITELKLAFGGMAAIPMRAVATEELLLNASLQDLREGALLEKVGAVLEREFTPISDARASAGYRTLVAKNLLSRLAAELTDASGLTQVRHHE